MKQIRALSWSLPASIRVVGVALIAAIVLCAMDASEPVESHDTPASTLRISVVHYLEAGGYTNAGQAEGQMCLPFGTVGPWETGGPQLIVTGNTGHIVGIVDVMQGTFEQIDERIGCVVRAELPIVDASLFTFAVADVYNETVTRDALVAAGWVYEVEVDLP